MNHAKACIVITDRTRTRFLKIAGAMHLSEDAAIRQAVLEFIVNHDRVLNE